MSTKVLVVEDDDGLRELLSFHLSQAGFSVLAAPTLAAAWAGVDKAAVVVLDLMLPDGSGVDWLRRYRAQAGGGALPVLMLTARASEVDKVSGLEAGADDYLVKPFSNAELVARLRALLRRTHTDSKHVVGDLLVDEAEGSATLAGQPSAADAARVRPSRVFGGAPKPRVLARRPARPGLGRRFFGNRAYGRPARGATARAHRRGTHRNRAGARLPARRCVVP